MGLTWTLIIHNPRSRSVGHLLAAIDRSLRLACYRDTILRIPFSHEVFRYLFQNKLELTLDFYTVHVNLVVN